MSKICFEHDGMLTPDSRGRVLAEVLRFMSAKIEPVPYGRLLSYIVSYFETEEESVSASVMHAVHVLVVSGFLTSNSFEQVPKGSSMHFRAETTISPSRKLTAFAYGETA